MVVVGVVVVGVGESTLYLPPSSPLPLAELNACRGYTELVSQAALVKPAVLNLQALCKGIYACFLNRKLA